MMDCVGRGLPAGAPVTVTVNEIGGSNYFVTWLPPADANGNVPFPYERQGAGRVVFIVAGGSAIIQVMRSFRACLANIVDIARLGRA